MTQYNTTPNPSVPDAYINTIAPAPIIQPVGTSQVAMVGVAQWGPVNAVLASSPQTYAATYGAVGNRTFDMGTLAAAVALGGGQAFYCTRVTDGTDTAATIGLYSATAVVTVGGAGYAVNDRLTLTNGAVVQVLTVTAGAITTFSVITPPSLNTAGALAQVSTTGVGSAATLTLTYTLGATITSKFTGSLANLDTVNVSVGTAASTLRVTIARPGQAPEVFDNIPGTGLTAWQNIVSVLNNGNSNLRPASAYVVATVGTSTVTPGYQTYTLVGGADGASSVTAAQLTGADGTVRTGMYALRGIGPSTMVVADAPSSMWAAINAFALSEGHYAVVAGPSADYQNLTVAATIVTLGIDTYAMKVMVGDYLLFNDVTNNLARYIAPSGYAAGKLASLNPWQSGLNKPVGGILGSQSTLAGYKYSIGSLAQIGAARLDLICNPVPGGSYWGLRYGNNASSNAAINGDNYSRMVPYLEYSIGSVAGAFVGRVMTAQEQNDVYATFDAFLGTLAKTNAIGAAPQPGIPMPKAYTIAFTATPAQQQQGYQIVSTSVTLGPIVKIFQVNLQAGQTVTQTAGNPVTAQ